MNFYFLKDITKQQNQAVNINLAILNACLFVLTWAKIVEMVFVPIKSQSLLVHKDIFFMVYAQTKLYFCHFRCFLAIGSPTCIITQHAPSLTSMVQL